MGPAGRGNFGTDGPPRLPRLSTDELVACPERVKSGRDPKTCLGGTRVAAPSPPRRARGQEGCRGGYPGFPEAGNPPREPPESGKRREREREPERAGGSLPVPPGVALGTLPGLGLLQGRSTRGSSWDSAGAVPPSPESPEPPATAIIIIIKFSVAFVTPATAADTSSATTNAATNSIPVLTATPALRSGIPVPFPVPCPALTPSRPNPVPVPISV